VSELEEMYANAASGRSTVYVRATFLREPHIGLRKFIRRDLFEALAEAAYVRAENLHRPTPDVSSPKYEEET
jgi:hypothetical protein